MNSTLKIQLANKFLSTFEDEYYTIWILCFVSAQLWNTEKKNISSDEKKCSMFRSLSVRHVSEYEKECSKEKNSSRLKLLIDPME